MTRKQREQVVELLRCAADVGTIAQAIYWRWPGRVVEALAWAAADQVEADYWWPEPGYKLRVLEAAARVEEGSWP